MSGVSVASLIDAIYRLRPEAAPTLRAIAEDVQSGIISGPHAFSDAIQERLGQTVLLDALLMLKGAPMTKGSADGDLALRARLVRHCIECSGQCSVPGCKEMRAMVDMVKNHTRTCTKPTACRTCIRFGDVMVAAKRRPVLAQPCRQETPRVVMAHLPETTTTEKDRKRSENKQARSKTACALPAHLQGMMMLARSALGELSAPGSANSSPRNSPNNSPERQRKMPTKKLKTFHKDADGRPCSPLRAGIVPRAPVKRAPVAASFVATYA